MLVRHQHHRMRTMAVPDMRHERQRDRQKDPLLDTNRHDRRGRDDGQH